MLTMSDVNEDEEDQELSYAAIGKVKWYSLFAKQVGSFWKS